MNEQPCPVADGAVAYGGRPAVVLPERVITYEELDRRVAVAVARLRDLGFGEGTRVGLYLPTGEAYMVLLVALLRLRCVACPISTRLPGQGVSAALKKAACAVVISDADHLRAEVQDVHFVPVEDTTHRAVAASGDRVPSFFLDQPALIISTSGSTGQPKAAALSWGNLYFNAVGSNENIPLGPGDRWLLSLPLYHVGGLGIIFRCLVAGAAIAIPEARQPFAAAIESFGITHVSMVATQLLRFLRERQTHQLAGLRAILLGGSAFPPALLEDACEKGLPLHASYGLTEMGSQVTTTPPGAGVETLKTSGRLLSHRELRISSEGEILVRGRTRFLGYVDGAEMLQPFDEEGWYHTGDLGALDAAGNLVVKGRRDNMFVSGGENIQPEEIEHHLGLLSGVDVAVVVPVPDTEFGFRPVAFVRTSGAASPETYRTALEAVLPRFKIPVAFLPLDEMQQDSRMKVDRRMLASRAIEMLKQSGAARS